MNRKQRRAKAKQRRAGRKGIEKRILNAKCPMERALLSLPEVITLTDNVTGRKELLTSKDFVSLQGEILVNQLQSYEAPRQLSKVLDNWDSLEEETDIITSQPGIKEIVYLSTVDSSVREELEKFLSETVELKQKQEEEYYNTTDENQADIVSDVQREYFETFVSTGISKLKQFCLLG